MGDQDAVRTDRSEGSEVDSDPSPARILELFRDCFLRSELASVLYVDGQVDGAGYPLHVDDQGSVSALVEVEDDFEYDPTHIELNRRLIHHGS